MLHEVHYSQQMWPLQQPGLPHGICTHPPQPASCCPVLHHSNRSAALLKLNKLAKALADAEECVKLDPSWDKGWMRKGMVLESQGQLQQVRTVSLLPTC